MPKRARVFVVQNQHRWDAAKQALVPKFDVSSAESFGDVVFLLGPTAAPFNLAPVLAELEGKLHDYQGRDFLLLLGNPVLIAVVSCIAARVSGGQLKFLQWSGKDQSYIPVEASV